MQVLIVAATESEILPFISKHYNLTNRHHNIYSFKINKLKIDCLITGVGSVATTYHLTKQLLQSKYDLALNTGIAGSFNPNINIGDVVIVNEDCLGDLGAEDQENFIDIFDMGFIDKNEFPFKNGYVKNINNKLNINKYRTASGITVNKVHGFQKNIDKVIAKYNPDIETMEGAAFLYVCNFQNIECVQLRAISNFVENRDKSKWDISLAIKNLNTVIEEVILSTTELK